MSETIIKEETDSDRAKRGVLEIKESIPEFIQNIEYISKNNNVCDLEKIQRSLAYLTVGFRLTSTYVNEIRDS